MYEAGSYDIAVIGAGHAGIEAALAAARLGASTVIFTMNLDAVGNMPCNPCLGGSAKGHLVREIDALGGEMAKAGDRTGIQFRTLNLSRGPAIHSPRVQIDRRAYQQYMKHALEREKNLHLKQAEIVSVELNEEGVVSSVTTRLGARYRVRALIICTGTYLKGRIIVGENSYESGPNGLFASVPLAQSLKDIGVSMLRFKTGTPARINRLGLSLSGLEIQEGDENFSPLSFEHTKEDCGGNRAVCYLTYTNERTHEVIRKNISRSPLYGGMIEGVGARYCPSIEDKIMRFPDKERHQLFIEPMGLCTEEMYLQGCSSSMPEEVQLKLMKTIEGLGDAQVMSPAYAIEYDCADPLQLRPSLEFKNIPGLYGAGQFNGTSGYEEAGAQGIVAGINAARRLKGMEPLVLSRQSSYIGTLIDDLVTKGTNEPYRMMTSRSEYRLLLRQGNADERLTPIGHRLGLISPERFSRFEEKWAMVSREEQRLRTVSVAPGEAINSYLEGLCDPPLQTGVKLAELLKRPRVRYPDLAPFDSGRPPLDGDIWSEAETRLKYEGYIKRQQRQADEAARLEKKPIPPDIDYSALGGLRLEAAEKLAKVRPETIGRAARISGVNPADITVLLIYLGRKDG